MVGLQHFSVSSRPLGFGFLGFGAKGLWPRLDNYHATSIYLVGGGKLEEPCLVGASLKGSGVCRNRT